MYNFKVDEEKCIHCGLCVKDCSAKALEFDENKIPKINEDACFKCQHCFAVCPVGAISIFDKNPENSEKVEAQSPEFVHNIYIIYK